MRSQLIPGASRGESELDYSETGLGNLRSILRRDFRILGTIGSQGSKDQLSFINLSRQIESGQEKGYTEREIMEAIIKVIAPRATPEILS